MNRRKTPLLQTLWTVGTVLCLAFYAARAVQLPRRTPLGTERRLFGGTGYTLLRQPRNGRWLVSAQAPFVATTAPPPSTFWTTFSDALTTFNWPGGTETGRTLAPFRDEGTWSIEAAGLRRVWRLRATEVKHHSAHEYLSAADPPALLDLKAGRTYRNEAAQRLLEQLPPSDQYLADDGWQEIDATDLLPLEGGDVTSPRSLNNNRGFVIGGRRVSMFWNDPPQSGTALYAASDHAAPRVLRLADGAAFTQLSPDGRTVFFERSGALWRLDLRRSLPELLDEAVPPSLPEPELDEPESQPSRR